jgi:hypothetical protein
MTIWRVLCLALLLWRAAGAQGPIRLKAREIDPRVSAASPQRGEPGAIGHFIVQFRDYPGPELRRELARRGLRVLAYVPESALMVSGPAPLPLDDLGVTWSGPLLASDKLSPALATEPAGAYLVVFHSDADMQEARAMVRRRGFEILESPNVSSERLLVTGAVERLSALAARDAVAYIMPATVELAARRRVLWCGGPIVEAGPIAEYALVGNGWAKDASGRVALGYFVQSVTTKVDAATARGEIERAFAAWARYANVTFAAAAAAGQARSIDILFASGAHGDAYAFDGPAGVLAHTFYPVPQNSEPIAGNMHFDASEKWGIGAGVDIFSVALHEAGHALGLAHSSQPGTVMYPYYSLATGLTSDDIAGAVALYGQAGASPSQPTTPLPTQPTGKADTTPPSLQIVVPSLTIVSTTSATIAVSGAASDNVAVARVTWSTSNGDSGNASGTNKWSATVPLLVGGTTVTVRAYDSAGNSAWRAITVVRR